MAPCVYEYEDKVEVVMNIGSLVVRGVVLVLTTSCSVVDIGGWGYTLQPQGI